MMLKNHEGGVYEATPKSNDFIHRPLRYYQGMKLDLSYIYLVLLIVLFYRLPSDTSKNMPCSRLCIPSYTNNY